MDYKQSAKEILDAIGTGSNLVSAAHCATRLRLVIADNAKVKKEVLENVDGVKGVLKRRDNSRSLSEPEQSTKFMMNSLPLQVLPPLPRMM